MSNPLLTYRHRPKPIGVDMTLRIFPDVLEIDTIKRVDRVSWTNVAHARLLYTPRSFLRYGFSTQLRLSDGRSVTFSNLNWVSLVEADPQNEAYRTCVEAVFERAELANPNFYVVSGQIWPQWIGFVIVSALLLLASVALALQGIVQAAWLTAALMAAFTAFNVWFLKPLVWRNRPRTGMHPDVLP
jgi:hypothetical protein